MKPTTLPDIEYPESDGEPMGETGIHVRWTFRLLELLQQRYEGHRVLVGANLIFYYVEGEVSRNICPDVFVVKDTSPEYRDTFLVWKEENVPNCVFELTSRSTRKRDEAIKPNIYAEIGIAEYFLYDPTADYLDPPLQGHRLTESGYVRIEPDADGRLESRELGVHLRLVDGELDLRDVVTGEPLPTAAEAERAKLEAVRTKVEAERARADTERKAREAAEAEVERLRQLLAERGEDKV